MIQRARKLATPAVAVAAGAAALALTTLAPGGIAPALAAPRTAAASSSIVASAEAGGTGGYWSVTAGGAVSAHDGARAYGSLAGHRLTSPVAAIASTSNGKGYWLVTSGGTVYAFGNARNHGSARRPPRPIVAMAATTNNGGYWLVTAGGKVYAFGNARNHGSARRPPRPIVAMAATTNNGGYWLVTAGGKVYAFGNAHNYGSISHPARSVSDITPAKDDGGYWILVSNGAVDALGSAVLKGSATAYDAATHAASLALFAYSSGYRVTTTKGGAATIGVPATPVVSPSKTVKATGNPSASVAPSAAFVQSCFGYQPNLSACNSAALADIDSARTGEGLGPLPLPSDFSSLGTASQVLAVANAERTSRGLPALPENHTLDSLAQAGAVAGADPTGPKGYGWGSNISWGYPTALAADFAWMYDDGVGSDNVDCTTADRSGCWGHRENILSPWAGASGAGVYTDSGELQLTELFVENY